MSRRRLFRTAGDFVTLVQALGSSGGAGFPSAEALRMQLLSLLEPITKATPKTGVAPDEAEEACFALVAWADEVLLKASWSGRDSWLADPLQKLLYQTNRAGNEFFEHLARLRPEQLAAREIYLLVLAFGFEGQYEGQPGDRRALLGHQYDVLRASRGLLETARERELSPAAYRLGIELPLRSRRGLGLGLGALVLGLCLVLVYAGLWWMLGSVSGEIPLPRGV
jgi:type VI secretion system protein ImpK